MSDHIRLSGVLEKGYGLAPKLIMTDESLSIESKAIYSYLASYCGNGLTAFPSIDLILKQLNIGRNRFYKYRKELIDKGYIKVTRRMANNKAISNLYTLCTQFEDIQIEDIQIEDVQNEYTNKNSLNNNNINNNRKKEYISPLGDMDNVLLTEKEYEKLKTNFPNHYQDYIDRLSRYVASSGKKYKSHYATILDWIDRDKKKGEFKESVTSRQISEVF